MKRFTEEEKGKGKAMDQPLRPRIRIRASDIDTSRLIRENALTLIGRVTNRKEQNMATLLPYLTRKWNLVGKIYGSDLGNDCFQFRFQEERDLKAVLENRPYQFNRWMIIVQQWEPIISPTFPSQIPFWISLKGIPLHFWDDKTLRDIGQEFGHLETYALTKTSARVRVMMDGLKPIPQDTILEFSAGEECVITLEYEKLENFCNYCLRLTHLASDCPSRTVTETREIRRKEVSYNSVEGPPRNPLPTNQQHHNQLRVERRSPPSRLSRDTAFHQRVDRHGNPFGQRAATYQTRAPPLKNKITPSMEREDSRRVLQEHAPTEISPHYSVRRTGPTREHLNRHSRSPIEQWRVKEHRSDRNLPKERTPERSPGQIRPPLERNLDKEDFLPLQAAVLPPPRTTEQVMEELREVTYRYANVADPVESAARRQRILDGEALNLMEQTAAGIVAREQEVCQAYLATCGMEPAIDNGMEHEADPADPLVLSQPSEHSKRRGRPPKPRQQREIRISPKVFKGSSSRKRNLTASAAISASPANQAKSNAERTTRRTARAGSTSTEASAAPSRPPTQVFPASIRQSRDFPRLSPPLP